MAEIKIATCTMTVDSPGIGTTCHAKLREDIPWIGSKTTNELILYLGPDLVRIWPVGKSEIRDLGLDLLHIADRLTE